MPEDLVTIKMYKKHKPLFDQLQLDLSNRKGEHVDQADLVALMLAEFRKKPL